MSNDTIYAWHCVSPEGTTRWLKTPDIVGVRYEVEGEVVPCESGLHASVNPLYALYYGDFGGRMKRVLLEGAVPHGNPVDKHAGRARTTLFELMPEQTAPVFCAFAFWCVEEIARPAAIKALRDAGREDKAATALEALPPVVDTESARTFRNAAAYAANAADAAYAACAAVAAAHAARDAYNAANAAYAAAAYAADRADYAADYAADRADYAADYAARAAGTAVAAAYAADNAAYAAAYAARAAGTAVAAAYAADNAAYAADYAARAAAARAAAKTSMGEELTRRLLELAPAGYTENKEDDNK